MSRAFNVTQRKKMNCKNKAQKLLKLIIDPLSHCLGWFDNMKRLFQQCMRQAKCNVTWSFIQFVAQAWSRCNIITRNHSKTRRKEFRRKSGFLLVILLRGHVFYLRCWCFSLREIHALFSCTSVLSGKIQGNNTNNLCRVSALLVQWLACQTSIGEKGGRCLAAIILSVLKVALKSVFCKYFARIISHASGY